MKEKEREVERRGTNGRWVSRSVFKWKAGAGAPPPVSVTCLKAYDLVFHFLLSRSYCSCRSLNK
jgi:hypothetical protein